MIDCIPSNLNFLDPIVITGHTSSVRYALFLNDVTIISASDDKTVRFWDLKTKDEIEKLEFGSIPNSIELSKDGEILSICSGNTVTFYNTKTMNKIKEHQVPTQVHSSTMHPDKSVFVCGGEDFKMYKYDYVEGTEIGKKSLSYSINQYFIFFNL